MQNLGVDIAIVGAGTAGLNARREAEKAGRSWVLIESGPYGTTCARVGCMPSKLLIAAADAAHEARRAERFGVHVPEIVVDGRAVLDRVRRERDRFAGFVVAATEALPEENRLRGHARFMGPTSLEVTPTQEGGGAVHGGGAPTRVEAGAVVLATGSSAWVPPPFDQLTERVVVNDDVFEWEELPGSVAVVGTGIIGLELGQALHRLGVEVTFLNPFEEVGPFQDPAVKAAAREILAEELDLQIGIREVMARNVDGGVHVSWVDHGGTARQGTFELVLAAAGRRPNLPDLAPAGIAVDERGRPPWDPYTTQVGDAPIFLAGDVTGHRPLLHEASDEGRIAGQNAARYPDVVAHVRRTPLTVAFTHPQMALVGERYHDLHPDERVVGEVRFEDQGRSRVMGINQGILRLYADRGTCRLRGAEMFGPRAEHLAHLLAWAVQSRQTVPQLLELPFYHPVVEEGLRTGLRDLAKALRILGGCRGEDLAESAGQ